MKKVIFVALALVAMTMQAKVEVTVSETVELMSILSRTAGFQEYNMDMGGQYIEDIEAWFTPFKQHPMVSYYQDLQYNYGIGFNAPASLAISLEIDGGQIKMVGKKELLDDRWFNVDLNDFVARLNQFYTDTRFHEFYQQHQAYYNKVLREYETNVMQYFHQDWYAKFYGEEPSENYGVIIGFTNGGNNYAADRQMPGKPRETYSICGYWIYPQMGSVLDPENAKRYAAPTLIHEFNHAFVNPLIEKETNAKLLGDIPQRLLDQNYEIMRQQAYPEGTIVFNETVVRAATILYMMENGYSSQEVRDELNDQLSSGFNWMPDVVAALRDYSANRKKYPTLNDYYPQIAKVLNNYLAQQEKMTGPTVTTLEKALNKTDNATASFNAEVMESVELMGVLSRIAGYREYNEISDTAYLQDIDQWFASFKQHPATQYFQNLREQYHIAYDAPMSLAVRLAVENGKIVKLQEETGDCGLDKRWDQVDMNEFLGLLNQFFTDTRFHEFFQQHQSYYQEELKAYNDMVMPYVHPEWFSNFLGINNNQPDRRKFVIGFANGTNGYGANRHLLGQNWDQYVIMGAQNDGQEKPYLEGKNYAMSLVSTFNRFSRQPLISDQSITATLSEVGNKLFNMNPNQLQMMGIQDGNSIVKKSISAAAQIFYMMENGSSTNEVQRYLNSYTTVFPWMPELVTAIGNYAKNRNKYPSISDFYPQIAQVLTKSLDTQQQRIDKALK